MSIKVKDKDTVTIEINGRDVSPLVKSYTLKSDLFGSCSTFECELFYAKSPILAFQWNGGVPYKATINGKVVQRGYLDKAERTYSKDSVSLKTSGRDMMQVLVDNQIIYPRDYVNFTIKQLINSIWIENSVISGPNRAKYYKEVPDKDPYPNQLQNGLIRAIYGKGQGVAGWNTSRLNQNGTSTPLPSPVSLYPISLGYTPKVSQMLDAFGTVPKYRTTYGQSLFEAMTQLINCLGILAYNIPGTDIIAFGKAINPLETLSSTDFYGRHITTNRYSFSNTKDRSLNSNNIIKATAKTDCLSYYKYVKVIGQSEDEQESARTIDEQGAYRTIKNNLIYDKIESDSMTAGFQGLTKFKVSEINIPSAKTWRTQATALVNNAIMSMNRMVISLTYTVRGHCPWVGANLEPYYVNRTALVDDDIAVLHQVDMLVYSVTFNGSKEAGMTTDLELCLPGTFPADVTSKESGTSEELQESIDKFFEPFFRTSPFSELQKAIDALE